MLKWTIDRKKLKGLGYTFQKLYANNYHSYRKESEKGIRILLWVVNRDVQIKDWWHPEVIIEFWKQNRHVNPDKDYLQIQINDDTKEIQFFDMDFYRECMFAPDYAKWNERYPPTQWRELFLVHTRMEVLIEELELIGVSI